MHALTQVKPAWLVCGIRSVLNSFLLLFLPLPKIYFFTPILPNSIFLLGGLLKALGILF